MAAASLIDGQDDGFLRFVKLFDQILNQQAADEG